MNDVPASNVSEKSNTGNRLAKVIARAGLCSRREAEKWISAGRVIVNGNIVRTPAFNVLDDDKIEVDNNPLLKRSGTRVWLYHKPAGLVVSEKDPEGRNTIFEQLKKLGLPRTLSIGRLDINTEGLLLLTNDGGLKRILELPSTGWLRRYRVRAHGRITDEQLAKLKNGIEIDGIKYGAINASIERVKGANVWINVSLREGKNREIKNVFAAFGLQVNRLIRISYGPFQLGDLPIGTVETVKTRMLKEQLGKKLAALAGVDFDSPLPEETTLDAAKNVNNPNYRMGKKRGARSQTQAMAKGKTGALPLDKDEKKIERKPAPYRKGNFDYKMRPEYEKPEVEKRIVHFGGSRGSETFEPKAKRKKPEQENERPTGFKRRSERFDRDNKRQGKTSNKNFGANPASLERSKFRSKSNLNERSNSRPSSRPSSRPRSHPKKTRK